LVLLMSIPGTALAVGFNALFADVVPPIWRSHVVGVRNALLSIVFVVTSLLCGWLLETLPFPLGYQVVFAIGFIGAAMSSLHLWFIRLSAGGPVVSRVGRGLGELAQPGASRTLGDGLRLGGLRFLTRFKRRPLLIPGVLSGRFGVIVGLLFFFHLAQYLAIPLFPLYWVNHLRLTDAEISLGNAVFYLVVLLGSTQLAQITNRSSHKQVMTAGVTIMCLYPLLTAVTQNLTLFLITSAIGGFSWSMVSGAISNYILERIPDDERPSHLAWYNLALNAAILCASLGGPALAEQTGLVVALVVIGIGRFTAALALWRWG
jgi:MFS family permease